MSSSDIHSHPQTEDETPDLTDYLKEDLFKKAMQGRWQEVESSYSENEKVRGTKITGAGDTLLHLAASSGVEKNVMPLVTCLKKTEDEQRIREILAIQNDRGDTALHIAAALGMVGVCLAMARLHPKMVVEIYNRWQETPLFKAVRHGQKEVFFALQSVVEEKLNIKPTPGVRRVRGDTILHEAIFAERFDLAWEIINCHPYLVDAMNENGESPLHVLANKPSAFKSGTHFNLLESVIYHGIFVDPLKDEYSSYKNKLSKKEKGRAPWTSGEDDKSKHITDVEIEISAHCTSGEDDKSKHITEIEIEIPAPWTNDDDDRPEHSIDVETSSSIYAVRSIGTTDKRDPENGVKEQQNGLQNRPGYPKNHYTFFDFFQFVVEFLLIVIGNVTATLGLSRVPTIKKREMNARACQIMKELVGRHKSWHYAKDGTKRGTTQGDHMPSTTTLSDVNDGSKQPNSHQQIENASKQKLDVKGEPNSQQVLKKLAKCCCKEIEDDSEQKPVGVTPILVAAKSGVVEMVEKILEDMPVAALDLDQDDKNIVLIAAENRQSRVYELMLKTKLMQDIVFGAVDKYGNSALHLAARLGSNKPWLIPGAALQMQWEIKWFKYLSNSTGSQFFMQHNMNGETAQEIFTNSHKTLVKDAGKWLDKTSQSCSVVAVFIATAAFTSATTVPGGVDQKGFPIFKGMRAFEAFAHSSLIALFFSIISLILFLSILTSHLRVQAFERELPMKLIGGFTTLFLSIVANLISFCASYFLVIEQNLNYIAYPIYAAVCLAISIIVVAQFTVYAALLKATFAKVPQRAQTSYPS